MLSRVGLRPIWDLLTAYAVMANNGWHASQLYVPQAKAAAQKALELDPDGSPGLRDAW